MEASVRFNCVAIHFDGFRRTVRRPRAPPLVCARRLPLPSPPPPPELVVIESSWLRSAPIRRPSPSQTKLATTKTTARATRTKGGGRGNGSCGGSVCMCVCFGTRLRSLVRTRKANGATLCGLCVRERAARAGRRAQVAYGIT